MNRATAAPDAPPALVAATHAVRRVIVAVDRDGRVHGWCVEASLILGWMLRQQGLPAEMRSCSAEGSPHWCITSGDWILDPTSGQWGEEPLLVFRDGSSDDWYAPAGEDQQTSPRTRSSIGSRSCVLPKQQPRFSPWPD